MDLNPCGLARKETEEEIYEGYFTEWGTGYYRAIYQNGNYYIGWWKATKMNDKGTLVY